MDYFTAPPAPVSRITTVLPKHLATLKTNFEALIAKAAANAGTADQAERLEALQAEVADLSGEWLDPSGRFTPTTTVHTSSDPAAWRDDDPSFSIWHTFPGHLETGRHVVTIGSEVFQIHVKSTRRSKTSAHLDAYATILNQKAA